MARLEIQLLGPPGIRVNASRVEGLPAKLEALIYYLATAPRSVTRSSLAGLLWSERSEQDARMNLRAALQKIPAGMNGCVTVARDWLAIDGAAELEVDVRRFEKLLSTISAGNGSGDRLERLREGAALYRDDFLHGFSAGHAPEFDSWCLAERTRLRQGAVRLHSEILALERAAKLDADMAQTARRILDLAPGHDAALRDLMEVLARSGQRNAAVEEFERHRKLWHEELGIAPSAETVRAAERIVSGESIAVAAVPAAAPPAQLVGREHEFALVSKLLTEGDGRVVSITGLGGIGKTRLAQALLAELKPRFADGAVLVSVGAMRSGAGLAPAIASALGILLRAGDVRAQVADYLREKALLLVLDSFEHVTGTEAVDLLIELARAAPKVRCLVTSREALGVDEEAVVALEGLAYPAEAAAATPAWRDFPAVQLFIQRAARGYVQFDAEREREGIVKLCRRVQGIPLAIELAASLARSLPCVEIARAVDRDLQALAKDDAGLSPRHRSLAGVLDTAFAQLTPELQGALARLSIFRGPFRADAAEAVAGCSLRQLSSLIEKSWLRRDAGGYLLHDVVRQFGDARLTAMRIDRADLREAHARHFNGWVATRERDIRMLSGALLEDILAAMADVIAAGEWAAEHGHDAQAVAALGGIYSYFEGRGDFGTARLFFNTALALVARNKRGRKALEPAMLCHLGWCLVQASEYDEGIPLIEDAIAKARAAGDDVTRANAMRGLALGRVMKGQPGAIEVLDECMALTRQLGDPLTLIATLNIMGVAASYLEEARSPSDYFRQMLELADEVGYTRGQMVAHFNLGDAAINQGRYDDAERHFVESLRFGKVARNRRNEVMSLSNLGLIAQQRGDVARTRAYLAEALVLARDMGDRRAFCFLKEGEAELAEMLEDWPTMLAEARRHAELAEAIAWDWSKAFAYALQAQALTRLGDRDAALETLAAHRAVALKGAWPVHRAAFALEASRWLLAFAADATQRELATRALRTLTDSESVDSWVRERARKAHAGQGAYAGLEGGMEDWMNRLHEALPSAR